jgi:hypothetical protein
MQRFGVGGEGETGAFNCLTLYTLSPAPDAGPFFESRSAHHGAVLSPATTLSAQTAGQFRPVVQEKPRLLEGAGRGDLGHD